MLEGQTFIEVFPDYTVPDNLKYVLSNAIVSKVVMKQQTRQLVVHLRSEHIIPRKVLNKPIKKDKIEHNSQKDSDRRVSIIMSGIKQPVISRMEKGTTDPQLSTVLKVLNSLGKTLEVVSMKPVK